MMAQHDREIREWRLAELVWKDVYLDGIRTRKLVEAIDGSAERRRVMAQRDTQLGRRKMPTFVVGVQS